MSSDLTTTDNSKLEVIPPKKKKGIKKFLKNLLFFLAWTYLSIKLFLTDVALVIGLALGLENITLFVIIRFLLILLILIIIWKKIGNKRFWKNIGLFFLFPAYPGLWIVVKNFFWQFPKFLLKNDMHFVLYSYIELIIDLIAEFKIIMTKWLFFVIGIVVLFNCNSYWLILPIVIFSTLQLVHLIKRYNQTFEPIKIFRINLDFLNNNPDEMFSEEKIIKQIEDADKAKTLNEEERVFKQMERTLMMSEFASAFTLGIKDILNNRTYLKSFLWKAAYSLFISMIFIGGINFALYKINPSNFNLESGSGSFFNFFFYSFFTIFPDGTDISPVTPVAKIVKMLGVSVGFVINLLILIVYITVANDKYKENLQKIITYSDIYSSRVKEYFKKQYGSDPAERFKNLKAQSSNIENIIKGMGFIFGKK